LIFKNEKVMNRIEFLLYMVVIVLSFSS